jgi:epoxide hydrolase-like predicted phosphatase
VGAPPIGRVGFDSRPRPGFIHDDRWIQAKWSRTGLLVDWGGVLTTSVFDSFSAFCATEGLAPETVRDAFMHDPAARDLLIGLETGTLAETDFEPRLCAALGLAEARAAGLIDRLFGGMRADEAMLEAVRAARRAGVRTGLVSNSWGVDRYDPVLVDELFDAVVISGRERIRKPDLRMYELGAERLGVAPAACVYVDDLPGNLKPARALGMATVHHIDAARTVVELQALLGIRLS